MPKKFLLIPSLLVLILCFSCEKEDDTDKLSGNPFPYSEEDAAGAFTVRTFLNASGYYMYGEKERQYSIDGNLIEPVSDPYTELVAADSIHVMTGLTAFEYHEYHDLDSTLRSVFGQEGHYTFRNSNGVIFTTALRGPKKIILSGPAHEYGAPPISVSKNTTLEWEPDPENADGMVVEIRKSDKNQYLRIADDGMLSLGSVWSRLPANGTFSIGLHRGSHTTVIGGDSKKYVINAISSAYSSAYTK